MGASRPVLGQAHALWLRDIMRDVGCTRAQREAMEQYNDGLTALQAACELRLSVGETRIALARCREQLGAQREDVYEVLLAAAGALLGCMRGDARHPARSDDDAPPVSGTQADLADRWMAWVMRREWG